MCQKSNISGSLAYHFCKSNGSTVVESNTQYGRLYLSNLLTNINTYLMTRINKFNKYNNINIKNCGAKIGEDVSFAPHG